MFFFIDSVPPCAQPVFRAAHSAGVPLQHTSFSAPAVRLITLPLPLSAPLRYNIF